MSSSELLINPLTYSVLSAEIKPKPRSRKLHTLGNLATTTFEKGRQIDTGDFEDYTNRKYKPGWAPVWSFVRCQQIPESEDWVLRRLLIEVDEIPVLEVHDSSMDPPFRLVVVSNGSEAGFNMETLQNDTARVQSYIRDITKDLFNKLA